MKTSTSSIKILRAALLLLTMLLPAAAALADDFITDVLVVGNSNQTQFNNLISSLVEEGWTDIPQDLNQGCGSGSAYIHLLYKRQSSTANTGTPITGFYIKTGSNPPDNLTHEGHTYYLVPCQGSESFVNGHGDLNSGCGSGSAYIFLYYTKDVLSDNSGVTGITFNTTQSGALGANGGTTGYDLNSGGGGAYIYMHLTTASGGNVVTLTSGSGDVQLLNGHILTGTGGADTRVSVTDGATVTFSGVNITAIANNSSHPWPGIECSGNATIVLNGGTTNSVKGGYFSPGIHVAANKTLTIQGSGTLNATGRDYAAGIGSGQSHSSCGNITISGGTVTATGGQNASGIGSGAEQQSCGNITVSGGTVNATGLTYAAGIGSGNQSSCGTITISGGTVTATGGLYAAAIGSGYQSSCDNITITNGVTCVTATRHNNSSNTVGAGNGSSTCGTVTIGGVLQTGPITMSPFVTYPYTVHFDANGGTGTMANQAFMYNVSQSLTGNAFTNGAYPFLGWATTANGPKVYNNGQSVSNLTQTAGATVTLYAKWGKTVTLASSTGEVLLQNGDTLTGTGGSSTRVKIADGATVTFSGVNNIAISNDSDHSWPGIHCLGNATIVLNGNTTNSVKGGYFSPGIYVAANKTLTIQGSGTLNATGRARGAGIGSGYQSSCGNITINSGTVNAIGGSNAAAIGSGYDYASCGDITISGGTVNATGGYYAAGIGSGCHHSSCGAITISGGTVTATGDERAAAIGSGYEYSSCGNINISGGTVTANGGQLAAAIGSGYYFASCGTITITNGVTRVTATKHIHSTNTIGAGGNGGTCGTITIGNVQQTEFITMSPFETYPYTVHFDANGGTGTMNDQALMNNVAQDLRSNTFTNAGLAFQGWATSATGPKVYDNGQSVSHLTDTIATVTLYAKWILSMNGDEYTIQTATGWDIFCNMLAENDNGYFTGKTVKLADSISVTTMAGSSGHEFSGTFDGQSHTLTVNYQTTDSTVCTAPFSYVNGATIQNLIVAGSITGTGHCAGIVGETGSSLSHITNCVSNVNVSGGNTAGISMGGNMEITGCVFNGKITGTSMSGGFVGSYNSALVISNSLFDPQADSSISGGTFYYNDGGEITLNNSYYTMPLGTSQGKQARSIVGGEHVTVAFNGQATTYNTSGIAAYSVGMVYGNTLYAGSGDTVSLNLSCTPPSGYVCSGYTPSAGTLTGTANPYTLAMPDAAVTIQALEQVAYIDSDGQTLTCGEYTVLTGGGTTTLAAGWYVVNDNITYTGTLTLAGDVTLILCNDKTMTVNPGSGNSISGSTLTIYGQTLDSVAAGTLYVTNNVEEKEAIELRFTYAQHSGNVKVFDSSDDAIRAHDNFTFNGGTVNVTTRNGDTNGICATNDITINGGTVNATGNTSGIFTDGNVTINGGTVNSISTNHLDGIIANNVTINGGTVTSDNIWSPTVTLGWSNITDCIIVSSFSYGETYTVSVKSGQAFYYENGNETVTVRGTLNSDQISAIGGKALRPLIPVSYVDGNGDPHTCDNYTVLNSGSATTLTEGWYVVNHNIDYTGTLTLDGDVNLILCNGKTMTVTTNSGNSICGLINMVSGFALTIYGQTLDSVAAGTLYVTNNVVGKNAIDLNTYTQHSGNVVVNDSGDAVIHAGDFTLNGGTINATGRECIRASNVTINGGIVNATGSHSGICGISNLTINGGSVKAIGSSYGIYAEEGNIIINGGTVNATSFDYFGIYSLYNLTLNGGTVNATNSIGSSNGIFAGVDIILGWTNIIDHILASSYQAGGTVSVKSGQKFYYQNGNEPVFVSDTLDEDQIEAIGGKTLIPFAPVAYIDENGVQQQCNFYTVVNNNLDFDNLPAGWYVVSNDITLDRDISFSGDAHLILCDSTAMNISVGIDEALYADGSLTLYGQSGGTGSLTALSLFGHGIDVFGNLTINGGTVNAISISGGKGIYSEGIVTINGGTVTALSDDFDIFALYQTINGGTVNATNSGYGIYAEGDIILGWTNTDDYILASSYMAVGTVSVKSGQAFCYIDENGGEKQETGIVVISGTLTTGEIAAICGKTLRPYVAARTVAGFGQGDGGWALIASPFGETNPLDVAGMLSGNHDLYAFVPNPSDDLKWRNYATDTFNLEAGKGYLYANADTVTLTFNGLPYSGNGEVALVYDATNTRRCWNLVGNPFPCAAYLDREYYVLDADGTGIDPEPIPASVPVQPCTAVFVKAVSAGDTAVFSLEAQP